MDSFVLALSKAHVLALNTAHVLRLNKADVLALNKAHVLRLNNKICPGISVESSVISVSCKSLVSKLGHLEVQKSLSKQRVWHRLAKTRKEVFQNMRVFFSFESGLGGTGACTGAPRPSPSPQPAHNTKVSREVASSQVMRIAARSAFLELVAEVTEVTAAPEAPEVVASSAAQGLPSTRAGGQDDVS